MSDKLSEQLNEAFAKHKPRRKEAEYEPHNLRKILKSNKLQDKLNAIAAKFDAEMDCE